MRHAQNIMVRITSGTFDEKGSPYQSGEECSITYLRFVVTIDTILTKGSCAKVAAKLLKVFRHGVAIIRHGVAIFRHGVARWHCGQLVFLVAHLRTHLSINNDSHKSLRVLRRLLLWAKGTRRFATTSLRVAGLMLMTNGDHLRVT